MVTWLTLTDALQKHPAVLLDTCILIRAFQQRSKGGPVFSLFVRVPPNQRRMSVVSGWEFFRGTAGKAIKRDLTRDRKQWLVDSGVVPVHFDHTISRGLEDLSLKREYSAGLADAILGASALAKDLPIATANDAHFAVLDVMLVREFASRPPPL